MIATSCSRERRVATDTTASYIEELKEFRNTALGGVALYMKVFVPSSIAIHLFDALIATNS
jgi:hypothetical protein